MLSTSAMRGFSVHTTLLTEIQKLSSLTIPRIGLWSAHGQSKQNSEWPWIKATDVHSHGATWHLIPLPERLCAFTEQKQDWLHGCKHKNTKQPPPPPPPPPTQKKQLCHLSLAHCYLAHSTYISLQKSPCRNMTHFYLELSVFRYSIFWQIFSGQKLPHK